ncbi:hypothetical protein KK083_31695 [Fulvivirgaceae bacterium PWU4]|uniref:Uncharacterized protein n=1 Tax=Chryseosolibacter histidini TaxID=2782349 RepID=A0AAP2GMQ2_9BACT|nr:hypothetical protein [Chryseosolibacter histidini]MBT1701499.1 hypothetical protein [Chryseosolibacter histidini]
MEITNKLEKFIQRVEALMNVLREQRNNLHIQNNVDQFYYMEKLAELRVLEENLLDEVDRLRYYQQRFESEYAQAFCRWKKDVRFLNSLAIPAKKAAEDAKI